MSLANLVGTWERLRDAIVARGGEVQSLVVAPPSPEHDVRAVEQALGYAIPSAFRDILTTFSAHAHFWWGKIPDDTLPQSRAMRELAAFGELEWDLSTLVRLERARQSWADIVVDSPREYGIWSDKLAFQSVGNGDLLGIDRTTESVVYLSHESWAEPGHGAILGSSFESFVLSHSEVACSGPDHFVLEHVLTPHGIDTTSPAAVEWRNWLGLPLE
jgi:hypothetical protein